MRRLSCFGVSLIKWGLFLANQHVARTAHALDKARRFATVVDFVAKSRNAQVDASVVAIPIDAAHLPKNFFARQNNALVGKEIA